MNLDALLFASVLFLTAAASWIIASTVRAELRDLLRFGCVLYVGAAVANVAAEFLGAPREFARAVALFVSVLAPSTLAVGLAHHTRGQPAPAISGVLLLIALFGSLAAAATGKVALGVLPLILVASAVYFVGLRKRLGARFAYVLSIVAMLSFLAAASSLVNDDRWSRSSFLLFSAAGLLGAALALIRRSRVVVKQARGDVALALIRQ